MSATMPTTVDMAAGAASHAKTDWDQIDWAQNHRNVRRLQVRIVKATQEGRWGKVKALRHLLTHSHSAKLLAVKRVTENQGRRTAGVDYTTPASDPPATQIVKPRPVRRASGEA